MPSPTPTTTRMTGNIVEIVYKGTPNNPIKPIVQITAADITNIGNNTPRQVLKMANNVAAITASNKGIINFKSSIACWPEVTSITGRPAIKKLSLTSAFCATPCSALPQSCD